jgi:DNA-binding response OmpR family regulator
MKNGKTQRERILSGKLKKGTLEFLLRKARDTQMTGILSVNGRQGFGVVHLRDGMIVSATSSDTKGRLVEYLVERGLLAKDKANHILEDQKQSIRRQLESVLLESPREEVHEILGKIAEDVLFGMLLWDGVYRFECKPPTDAPFELSIDIYDFMQKIDLTEEDLDFWTESAGAKPAADSAATYKEEICDTLEHVAKSLTTFKPREVVIVVEDEVLMRTMMVDGLRDFGFEVEAYDNVRDAMKRIQELDMTRISPAVVLDLMMTGLYDSSDVYGGIDLLSYICKSYPSVPVIIATAIDDLTIKLHTCFLGSSYFINKPDKKQKGLDDFRSHVEVFIEELSFNLENLFRKRQAYLEKEQLVSIREELLIEFIKKGLNPIKDESKILDSHILIVDDEIEICNLAKEFLEMDGFTQVDIATNGKEAIDLLNKKKHDVVVTDIVMPKKNGIELLRYTKILSPNSQVIMITGYADKRSAIAAIKLGAFDFIEKPIDFKTLPQTVRKGVELKCMLDDRHWN